MLGNISLLQITISSISYLVQLKPNSTDGESILERVLEFVNLMGGTVNLRSSDTLANIYPTATIYTSLTKVSDFTVPGTITNPIEADLISFANGNNCNLYKLTTSGSNTVLNDLINPVLPGLRGMMLTGTNPSYTPAFVAETSDLDQNSLLNYIEETVNGNQGTFVCRFKLVLNSTKLARLQSGGSQVGQIWNIGSLVTTNQQVYPVSGAIAIPTITNDLFNAVTFANSTGTQTSVVASVVKKTHNGITTTLSPSTKVVYLTSMSYPATEIAIQLDSTTRNGFVLGDTIEVEFTVTGQII